jgi:hypothetical protein
VQELLVEPTAAVVTNCPYTVAKYCDGKLDQLRYIPSRNSTFASHVTDHLPVTFSLHKVLPNGNANKTQTIPEWTLDHPHFGDHFRVGWMKIRKN